MKDRLHSPPKLRPQDPLFTLPDDSQDPPPTPPYRTFASTSQVVLDSSPSESPAYRSRINLMADYTDEHENEKVDPDTTLRPTEADVKPQPKPTVHYPNPIHAGPAPSYHVSPPRIVSIDSSQDHSFGATDEEDDVDDYDWSGEDDLVDEEAKFEQQMGVRPKPQGWGFKRIVTFLFSSLIGSTFLSCILITPAILIHFYWYKRDPTPHRRFVKDNVQAWLFWAAANLLISWYLALIVDIIPAVARFMISVSWGHVSEYVKGRIELYDSIKHTIKPLLYAASGWASWIILFGHIFNLYDTSDASRSWAPYTRRVAQAVEFLFFFALVICAQKMLSHAIAFAFHRTAYKERMDSLRFSLRVLETLRNYRHKSRYGHYSQKSSGTRTPVLSALGFGGGGTFNEKEHYSSLSGALQSATPDHSGDGDDEGTTVKSKGKQKRRSKRMSAQKQTVSNPIRLPMSEPSSRPMTPSGLNTHRYPPSPSSDADRTKSAESHEDGDATLVHAAKVLKTAVLHDARNLKGKEADLGGLVWDVNSAHEAKRLARSVYIRFKDRHRNFLIPSDFHPAFATTAEAETAFRVFDTDNNGDISRAEIKTTLLKVYKERRFLSRSMQDVSVALKTLDHIVLFFAFVILFFISLSVFGVNVVQSLTSVYSIGIAASFIFKNSASNAFDAIMFLFVTHPYDTGDRCFIDDENLVVKKMGLFATVFTRSDGTETYYFNSQLFSKFITNVRRSGKMFENLTMQVQWRTPLDKLDALEKCLNEWLATEENRWFEPSTSVTLQRIDFQRHLEITIGIGHNGTWQDWGLRNQRKTAFHAAVNFYCRQLGIMAHEAPLPIVYADTDTQSYLPPATPLSGVEDDFFAAPPSPFERDEKDAGAESVLGQEPEQVEKAKERENVKPIMGFLPPPEKRSALVRARKSKNRKGALRSMGADG